MRSSPSVLGSSSAEPFVSSGVNCSSSSPDSPPANSIALRVDFDAQTPLNAQLPVGIGKQLGRAFRLERRQLLQLLAGFAAGEIDLPRLESLVETNLPQLQFFNAQEHKDTPGLSGRTIPV